MKVCTGDSVVVITGKDKGKTGQVLRVLPHKSRVVVSGINMRTKHVRKTPQRAGQILHYEASIDVSNVMLVDPKTKKRTRIGLAIEENGKKKRIAKRSGEVVGAAKVSAKKKSVEAKEAAPASEAEKKPKEEVKKDVKEAKKETKERIEEPKKADYAPSSAEATEGKKASPARQPFWKRMGFGAEAMEESEEMGASTTKGDRPDKMSSSPHRSGERGS